MDARNARNAPLLAAVPHYRQTLDFTCGPSSLMMAMKALDPAIEMSRALEMKLWKEATTIFGGHGHGGCSALGLALAAHRRGFEAEIHVSHRDVLFANRTREADRRDVVRLLHEGDLEEAARLGIPVTYRAIGLDKVETKFRVGFLPIVLVSTHYVHGDRVPHWIVVTGFDDGAVFINDPWVAVDKGKTARDMSNLRIPRSDYGRMARYGRAKDRATVLVRRRGAAT